MKKILFAVMALGMSLVSCTNEEIPAPAVEYGYINLNVSNDPVVQTRATVSTDALVNWTAVVKMGETEKFNDTANTLSAKSFASGTYSVSAYNYVDDAAANEANENWGDARYEGADADVVVEAGKTAQASISCGKAKNIRVGVVFNESFTSVAQGYSLSTSVGERSHTFNSTTADKKAYYSVGQEIAYTLTYTFQGIPKEVTGEIDAVATGGVEHSINVKMNTNGSISIAISYDDFTPTDKDITIDGGSGEEVKNS